MRKTEYKYLKTLWHLQTIKRGGVCVMGEIWGKTDILSNFGLSMNTYVKVVGQRPT